METQENNNQTTANGVTSTLRLDAFLSVFKIFIKNKMIEIGKFLLALLIMCVLIGLGCGFIMLLELVEKHFQYLFEFIIGFGIIAFAYLFIWWVISNWRKAKNEYETKQDGI